MTARKIQLSVECCDASTGEMAITAEDPGNPDPEFVYQDMILDPAALAVLHGLLGYYVTQGIGSTRSVTLNAPADAAGEGATP